MSKEILRIEAGRTVAVAVIVSLVLSLFAGTYAASAQVVTDPSTSAPTTGTGLPTGIITDQTATTTSTSTPVSDTTTSSSTPSSATTTQQSPTTTAFVQPTQTQQTVTPSALNGWTIYGTGGTGRADFVRTTGGTGDGALRISTPDNANEVQLDRNDAPVPVSSINLTYQSKRLSGDAHAAPAYVLGIDTNGDGSADTYAWFEPVYNYPAANYDQWNTWTIDQASRLYSNGATEGNFFTLAQFQASHPGATVVEYTLNQGSGNAGWSTLVDNVGTPYANYNFEPSPIQTYTVTPSNHQGWTEHEYGTGATATYVDDAGAAGTGALQLSTPDGSGEVLYDLVESPTPVGDINVSYRTRRVSGPNGLEPAYIFGVDKDGNSSTTTDILYVYYEPIYNQPNANFDAWNTWTIDQNSKLWSFDTVSAGKGGANGANLFTFQDVKAAYPNATVAEYTLNVGSGTPGATALVDQATTPNAIYNFDRDQVAVTGGGGGGGGSRSAGQRAPTSSTTSTSSAGQPTQGSTGGQVLGASTFQFNVNLHLGSIGNDVTELQKLLIAAGYLHINAPTGYFGVLTRAAVAAFQRDHNITPAVGFFGPITRALVNASGMAPMTPAGSTTTTTSSTTTTH